MTDIPEKEEEQGTVEKISLAYVENEGGGKGHQYYVFEATDLERFIEPKQRMEIIKLFKNIQQAKALGDGTVIHKERNYVIIPLDPLMETRFKTAMQYKPKTVEEMLPWARDFLFGDTGDEKPKIKRDFPK